MHQHNLQELHTQKYFCAITMDKKRLLDMLHSTIYPMSMPITWNRLEY